MKGVRHKGTIKRTWRIVKKDCEIRQVHKEDVMDHSKWRNLIKRYCVIPTKIGSK